MSQISPSHWQSAGASLETIQQEVFVTACRLDALNLLVSAMLMEEAEDSETSGILGVSALFQDLIGNLHAIRGHLEQLE